MTELSDLVGIDAEDDLVLHATELAKSGESLVRDLILQRKRRGLSQRDVGKLLNVSQAAVGGFERSGNDPRLSTLRRYAMAVGADITHIVMPRERSSSTNWARGLAQGIPTNETMIELARARVVAGSVNG